MDWENKGTRLLLFDNISSKSFNPKNPGSDKIPFTAKTLPLTDLFQLLTNFTLAVPGNRYTFIS